MARFRVRKPNGSLHGIAKTHANSLIRYGHAIEVQPGIIVMLAVSIAVTSIPEHMPPVDLPGLHFEEPTSDTWKKQHRSGPNP